MSHPDPVRNPARTRAMMIGALVGLAVIAVLVAVVALTTGTPLLLASLVAVAAAAWLCLLTIRTEHEENR